MNQIDPARPMTALGLMSGTSFDGIDAAILVTDGEAVARPGPRLSQPYEPAVREELRAVMAAAAVGDLPALRRDLASLEARLTDLNRRAAMRLIEEAGLAPADIDVVGYHGQTILHRPADAITVQLGDGAALARATGIAVVNDFRAADVAAGGEGAPFAPAYHRALALASGVLPQVVVNIGGVANLTWVAADGDPVAFDTGPGNALIDDFVSGTGGLAFDEGGALALAGRANEAALPALLDNPYFALPPPKSLDRNAFDAGAVAGLTLEDGAATLAAFTVATIAKATSLLPGTPARFVICGGGRHNRAIMAGLEQNLAAPVVTAEDVGWRGDDIEAEAFAYLAVRSLRGLALSWPTTTGVPAPTTGGVTSLP